MAVAEPVNSAGKAHFENCSGEPQAGPQLRAEGAAAVTLAPEEQSGRGPLR